MKNIEENNKLIAEFMGFNSVGNNEFIYAVIFNGKAKGYHSLNNLSFHTSWDWLMPVVEKIENTDPTFLEVRLRHKAKFQTHQEQVNTSKLNYIYNEVIGFISWYNKNK